MVLGRIRRTLFLPGDYDVFPSRGIMRLPGCVGGEGGVLNPLLCCAYPVSLPLPDVCAFSFDVLIGNSEGVRITPLQDEYRYFFCSAGARRKK